MARFTQAVQHLLTVGRLQAALVEGSSPIVRGRGPVPMSASAKGLGGFGKVRVAASLWQRVVPASLLGRCRRFLASARGAEFSRELRRRAREMGGDKARVLDAMLWVVRAEGGLKRGGGGG